MRVFCVISHTHWDREWYLPLESMRLRLCDLIDRCIEIMKKEPDFIFHLDAQTIVLEDYLSIRTDRRELLKELISAGRLVVGPWYQQNDFYLTSGEATVRNLLEGHQIANEFGACAKVGYAPDQFGNISQLPQILANFDIDNFVFGRGFNHQLSDGVTAPTEFIWQGPDGTQALAVHMRYWYNNAQHFSADIEKAKTLVKSNENLFENITLTPYVLMMNGVDHTEAQGDLLPILDRLGKDLPEGQAIKQYRMQDYIDTVREYIHKNDLPMHVHHGELRQGGDHQVLQGTFSSRYYLKAANVKAQTMLENKLEPLYSMLELAGAKGAYSLDHFRYMWKQLMKNHPHDSICGCSCDAVHHHMEDNYARLETTMRDLLARGMQCAAVHLDTPGMNADNKIIAVANTTQRKCNGVVEVTMDLPKDEGFEGFEILDGNGTPADYMVVSKCETVRDCFSPLNLPGNIDVDRYRVYLNTEDVEPFAFRGHVVNGTHTLNVVEPLVTRPEAVLENDLLRVTVADDGRVAVFSKAQNRLFENVLDIEDTCDFGHAYLYYSDGEAIYGGSFPATVEVLQNNRLVSEVRITRDMVLPTAYDFSARCRKPETAVTRVALTLKLTAGSEHLEVSFAIDNKSCDHRLRLLVNTGIATDLAIADIPFDIVAHSDADHDPNTGSKVLPNSTFSALEQDNQGFAVLTEGAHEFEHLGDTLAFTMVRSTGVICRDLVTLEQVGGENWAAPGNQCLRRIEGRVALQPYVGNVIGAEIPVKSVQFRAGLSAFYFSCDETKFMRGRAIVQGSLIQEFFYLPDPYEQVHIPDNQSLVRVSGEGILVTALKKAQDETGLMLRAVNLSDSGSTAEINADGEFYRTAMSEESSDYISSNDLRQEIISKKIISVKIR